jgi:hypothetical protein
MLVGVFEEQDDNSSGKPVSDDKFESIPMGKLDYRQYPSHAWTFILVFVVHFVYFHILGPVISVFFLFSKKLLCMCYNMHFIRLSRHSLEGLVCFLLTYLLIISSEKNNLPESDNADEKVDETYAVCLYNKIIIYVLRCIIIASKYNTFGEAKLSQMWNRIVSDDEMKSQHSLEDWADQSPEMVFK